MERLLSFDEVAGHDLVFGELLIGDTGGRGSLLDQYQKIQQATTVPHREVAEFVRARCLSGRGIGWIDVHLLASAIVGRMLLWTADARLVDVADSLGVAYSP